MGEGGGGGGDNGDDGDDRGDVDRWCNGCCVLPWLGVSFYGAKISFSDQKK